MDRHDIIVIGGSAGALDPPRKIVTELPSGLAAKLFVVLHRPAQSGDMLRNLHRYRASTGRCRSQRHA